MTKMHFLTSLSVGCPYRALLSDHENKRFIIIVLREEPQQVVALEINWSSIVGVDYRCPLHDDGKLVLEARQVVKRCFKTVGDARDFYSPHATVLAGGSLRTSHSAAPTPSKVSLDGRHALFSSTSSLHLGAALAVSPPRAIHPVSWGATSSTGMGLRLVASADVRSVAGGISGSVSAGGEWLALGRGVASGGFRPSVEPGAQRSSSATRAPRTSCRAVHAACTEGTLAMASDVRMSHGMDFASADESEGACRHLRISATGMLVPDGLSEAGVAARRRLQLRSVEALPGSGAVETVPAGAVAAASVESSRMCAESRHRKSLGGSSRKARSTNDLCGLDGTLECLQSVHTGNPSEAAAAGLAVNSAEWCASAAGACTRAAAAQTRSAVCSAGRLLQNRTGTSAGSGIALGCGSSIDSLRAAFLSEQQQQHTANEWLLRRRNGGGRVRREHASCTQLTDVSFDSRGCNGGEMLCNNSGVPRASRWTQPSATFYSKTLVLGFRDPFLPQELRRFVKSDMRILKLYESGLPPWAVFMPSYGLPYRPWLRRALWLLFIAVSIFSMGCGFYDLYKNVPFLKQVITAVASRMYLPASELFEWLERHTQIRMSILLTYLFSKSPLLMSLMRMLRSLVALLQQLMRPAAMALSEAMQPVLEAVQVMAASVGGGVMAAAETVWRAMQPFVTALAVFGREVFALAAAVLGPPARALWAMAVLLAQLVRLVAALIGMVFVGPLQLACSIGGVLTWASAELAERLAVAAEATRAAVQWMVTLGRAARRAAPAVKAGARLAAQAAGSAAGGGGGGLSGGMAVWQWLGLEVVGAYNAVRLTFLQAFKSAQAVVNFCVTVAQTAVQHRVSLLLQLRRFITRQKERLPPAVAASVPLPAFVSMPSFTSLPPFDIPLPGPDHDADLDEEPELVTSLSSAPAEHSLYDLDMVHLGSTGDESHLLAAQPPLYCNDGNMPVPRDSAILAEPIPVPLGGRGGGLRRRHHSGASSTRLGTTVAGNAMYGMYDVSRQRLDAVNEEDLEDAQQLSDRDGLVVETYSGGDKTQGPGAHLLHGRQRYGGYAGTRDVGGNVWLSQRDFIEIGGNGVTGNSDYASAPGRRIDVELQDGRLLGDSFHAAYGARSSQSFPSPHRDGGPEPMLLSRSVPSAAADRSLNSGHCHEAALSWQQQQQQEQQRQWQEEQQRQPHQTQLKRNPNHHAQQQRRRGSARGLGRIASSPPDGAAGTPAAQPDAATGDGRSCRLARRHGGGGVRCEDRPAAISSITPAMTAGAVASGALLGELSHVLPNGPAPASPSDNSPDELTCSSPFAHRGASACLGNGAVSTINHGATGRAAVSRGVGAASGGKVAAASDNGVQNKGRGGAEGGGNNACGKRPSAGAKHISRPAIQAA
ncbi:hypothetical protein VOLCADRAFT_103675 [Volvox carteri f. nagariensis]|uniref:Uncharacterized protein n=1 Tax=Volvox carteri f. nagariensis TaxID=3068 RepID=D8TNQ9_VOLCA|nr:uncharacterized protein VOLCADRAFT_103675 [Volvox carteri f. nagariensis]EFJ51037.1 hypothetical protein VOLCADRAFT_103675 [Volvox carteri f. nagariensis]|eukprot:XP_002948049.1 hypothetical protein VOLCADRAFT_103675 [Volvox carteri f. nagariensis]